MKHDLQERIEDLISFLDEQTEAETEYSEPLAPETYREGNCLRREAVDRVQVGADGGSRSIN